MACHYAIASLQFTIGLPEEDLRRIDSMAKKRATADYVCIGEVSESMIYEAIALAEEVVRAGYRPNSTTNSIPSP